jgi:O-antigen ligase
LTERKPVRPTEWLLLALIGVFAFSIFTHDWTVNRNLPLSRFLFYYLMPFGMYLVGREVRVTERAMKAMFALLGAFGVYVALTAVAEAWDQSGWIFPRYIVSEDYASFLGRARGPLLNPAGNGVLLAMCLGGGLMAWPRADRLGRLLLVAFTTLMAFAIYCTMTRSAWMGGALGLLIVVFLALPRVYRPWFVGATVIGASLLAVTQWDRLVEFKRDKYLEARQTANSAELRPILAAIAWEMFTDQPILGCGFGHYTEEHVNYLADRSVDLPLEEGRPYVQHNSWLALLAETGLVGTALVILIQVSWLRTAWRLWKSEHAPVWMRQQALVFFAVAASYFMNGTFQDIVIIAMTQMYLFFMAGLTVNLGARSAEIEDRLALGYR